jgi:hypothetical protein
VTTVTLVERAACRGCCHFACSGLHTRWLCLVHRSSPSTVLHANSALAQKPSVAGEVVAADIAHVLWLLLLSRSAC